MNPAHERDVLLGALLDRLGTLQARALLQQLEQWLTGENSTVQPHTNRFDQDQIRAFEGPYDRRRQDGNGIHNRHPKSASLTPKDTQS